MTDNEIKKALENLFKLMLHEGDLQRASIVSKALDLINRKDAEIERLKNQKCLYAFDGEFQDCIQTSCFYRKKEDEVKSETIEEFVEKFKRKATVVHKTHSGKHWYEINDDEIDNLVKEIAEVN